MEVSAGNRVPSAKRPLEISKPANGGKKQTESNGNASSFVNYAAMAWHENRKKWVGDQSQRQRVAKEPIISWSTTYEELLSSNEPFSERIPLTEMVDFLVDIWQDEGLYD